MTTASQNAQGNAPLRQTRELWLENFFELMKPRFAELGFPLPENLHVSVGFGYGARAENGKILGQTWMAEASDDDRNQVFITPESDDVIEVLGIFLHELVHVADNNEHGHQGKFVQIADALGLAGKPTEALPGDELVWDLIAIADTLGEYPHSKINFEKIRKLMAERQKNEPAPDTASDGPPVRVRRVRYHSGPAPQSKKYWGVYCPEDECDYIVRLTRKHLDRAAPMCGIHPTVRMLEQP